jgi:malto-oligosyltrehalose trehalohydrolase
MALRLASTGAEPPMRAVGEGWFEFMTDAILPGEGYSYVLPGGMAVNDPAARAQLAGVNGPSRIVDPRAYQWRTPDWRGRPLEEVALYELHTGTFSPEGTFEGVRQRLDYLADLGVTAIELMPVAEFSGNRGWGYDGVLLYCPHAAYGGPEGLKRLIDAAHERALMVFLDVVYNHFGPEGNYLHLYAPDFFHLERKTPWGGAIAYEKKPVRDFFIENALYWLEEYRFDGLRLDAIDAIDDQSEEPILEELALAVRRCVTGRHVHLMTEDDRNITRLHERDAEGRPRLYSTEWNDDFHHAAHRIATGEHFGYYGDYAERPVELLARALATGFVYQGEPSPYRDGRPRGSPSAHLPPAAFLNFLQNHDQTGNRAFGERLTTLADPATIEALTAILLLSPQIPLLFMGEEYGETNPFYFFTDFHGELGELVREGRCSEFSRWPAFAEAESRTRIPNPNAEDTFAASRLDWGKLDQPQHRKQQEFVKTLLAIRQREIVPLVKTMGGNAGTATMFSDRAFQITWSTVDDDRLSLLANLGDTSVALASDSRAGGRLILSHGEGAEDAWRNGRLTRRSVLVLVEEGAEFVPLPI